MASRGSRQEMGMTVKLQVPNQAQKYPEASVFIVIDTSGSMRGAKLREVCEASREIIANAPNFVRFDVNVFNTKVTKLVSKKKKYIDLDRLMNDVKNSNGSLTALYDGWGQTMNDIPYRVSKLDYSHVLVFTDGKDNCSKTFDLKSVISLLDEKLNKNSKMYFTLIQAGPISEVMYALQKPIGMDRCSTINVEDSANGIRMGFDKVKRQIATQLELHVNISVSPYGKLDAQMNLLSLDAGPGHGHNATSITFHQRQPGGRQNIRNAILPSYNLTQLPRRSSRN